VYLHHPLVHRPDGTKVSKANQDAGIRDLRAAGRTPEDVLGLAAHVSGLLDAPRPVRAPDLASLFEGDE
jgi:glutamyl-tRNA synthetase